MKSGFLVIAGALAAGTASAEEIQFDGHVLEIGASGEARPIVRIAGTRYRLGGSTAQIVGKAEACVAAGAGLELVSADAASGVVSARGAADYRQLWSVRSIRANLQVEASDGYFRIVQTDLVQAPDRGADAAADAYAPVSQGAGDWEGAVAAAIDLETRLVDCLYR